MRLGVSSYTYTWAVGVPGSLPDEPMSAAALTEKAASLGLGLVQICDNLPLDRLAPPELDALERRARELGVDVEIGTRGIRPEHLRTYLALARRLGSGIVRAVVDTADHKPSLDQTVGLIREITPEFEAANTYLAIENHDRFTAHEFVRIIERVGTPNVGMCLDTVNSFGALEGPEVVVETLAPYTLNLHIKDFSIRRVDHQMGFVIEGTPAGKGRLDVPWLLDKLRHAGRDPNAILELWTPPEPTIEATIAKEEAWAAESVGYLKGVLSS